MLNEKGVEANFTESDLFKEEHEGAAKIYLFANVPVLVGHKTGLEIFVIYNFAGDWLICRQSAVTQSAEQNINYNLMIIHLRTFTIT